MPFHLASGNICPQHQKPVERIKESSYFFRLSKYTQPLLDWYAGKDLLGTIQGAGAIGDISRRVKAAARRLP